MQPGQPPTREGGQEDLEARASLLSGVLGLPPGALAGVGPGLQPLPMPAPGLQYPAALEQAQHLQWPQLSQGPGAQQVGQGSWHPGSSGGSSSAAGGGAADAAAGGRPLPAPALPPVLIGGSRLDPQTMAAKLAAAREKNRLAQQRFRERQREKQKQAGQQCEVLQQEMDQLAGENEQLQRQNRIYEKVLAVRDAMLQTFTSLHPPHPQQQQQQGTGIPPVHSGAGGALPAPATAAAQGLARALEEMPSEREMEDVTPAETILPPPPPPAAAPDHQAGGADAEDDRRQAGAGAGPASSSSCTALGAMLPLEQVPAPQLLLGEQHRSGTASGLDGSALEQVEIIPPANNQLVRARVAAWTEPEQLLDFFRQWQAELSMSYLAAEAAGFDAASVREVEGVTDRMTEMWFHVGQLKPAYLCFLCHAALPDNSSQLPLWRDIAAHVLPQMDETSRAIVRRSWHNYSKRLAKVAIGVSKWVRRLQQFAVQPTDSMAGTAAQSIELAEITNHVAAAVQEEYTASMEFVAAQFPASSTLLKAYVNHASAPFLPDLVAIVYNMLCLDSEEKAAKAAAATQPAAGRAAVAGAAASAVQPAQPGPRS